MGQNYEFEVEGEGFFPTDMLRYDQCWPSTEQKDSPAILGGPDRATDRDLLQKAATVITALEKNPALMAEVFRQLVSSHEGNLYNGKRRVTLRGAQDPTKDRWASFGWKVR